MPLFSIITSTLNNLEGLKKTAASLKDQTSQNFEWMIADGDSTDGTQDFLNTTKAVWTSEPDSGIYDAWNKTLPTELGDYVIFLPAGDRLYDKHILQTYEDIIKDHNKPDFIYGDAVEAFGETCHYKKAYSYRQIKKGIFTHVPAMVFHRRIIHDLKFDTSFPVAADYKYLIESLRTATDRIFYIPQPLCVYESGGFSQINAKQGRLEQFRIRQNLKLVSGIENIWIYLRQTIAWQIRKFFPKLFWRLKSGH